jgi:excisionase family DNA binding protein
MPDNTPASLLTTRDVCDRLRVHRDSLRRWEAAGRIRPIRIAPHTVRYRPEDVERLLDEASRALRQKPGPKPKAQPRPLS